jgi:hypothetical protein
MIVIAGAETTARPADLSISNGGKNFVTASVKTDR